jgi:hypothetical protein
MSRRDAVAVAEAITLPVGSRDYVSGWFNDPASSVSIIAARGYANDPDHASITLELDLRAARGLARFLLDAISKIEEVKS